MYSLSIILTITQRRIYSLSHLMASSLMRSLVNTRSKKHFEYNVLSIGNVYFGDRCWKAKNHLIVFAISSKIHDRREGVRCALYYQTRHTLV